MGEKEEFEKKIEAQLDEWGAELQKLKAKADGASADAKLKYYDEIKKLEKGRGELLQKLEALKQSGDQAWKGLQSGVEKGWNDLKKGIEGIFSKFK